jgi:peroxiredoxin
MSRFRDNRTQFTEANTVVLGVSVDSVWANKAFREQLGIEFPILSDTRRELSRKLGVLDDTNDVARRTTFVIDTQGIIRHVDQQRDAAAHADGAIGVCRLFKKSGA